MAPGQPAHEQAERDDGQHHQGDPTFGPFGPPTYDQESQREHDRREDEEQFAPIAVDLVVGSRRAGGDFQFTPLARLFGLAIFGGGSDKVGLVFFQIVDLFLVVGLDLALAGDFVDLALEVNFLALEPSSNCSTALFAIASARSTPR